MGKHAPRGPNRIGNAAAACLLALAVLFACGCASTRSVTSEREQARNVRERLMFGPKDMNPFAQIFWFGTIGLLGVIEISSNLSILGSVNPVHAIRFAREHGSMAFIILGSVVLVVTGAAPPSPVACSSEGSIRSVAATICS